MVVGSFCVGGPEGYGEVLWSVGIDQPADDELDDGSITCIGTSKILDKKRTRQQP